MAKLKIGNGIKFQAELPKVDQSEPKIEHTESALPNLLEKLMAMMPQPTKEVMSPQKEVDKQIEVLRTDLFKVSQEMETRLNYQIHDLALQVDEQRIVVPEVKHITNIKDVSEDVRLEIKDVKNDMISRLMNHANHIVEIESKLKVQRTINLVLGAILILTTFLHLL